MWTRRDLLGRLAAGAGAWALATPAMASDGSWDISYIWSSNAEAVLDYKARVADVLGPEVARNLVFVRGNQGNFGLVYNRPGTSEAAARRVAANHDRALRDAFGGRDVLATPIRDAGGYSPTRAIARGRRRPTPTKTAHTAVREPTPPATPVVEAPPPSQEELPARISTPLRDLINEHIQGLRRAGAVASDETTSWYVHTLHDNRTWVAINAERKLQCASMVKPYVALAFMHQAHSGRLIYGPKSKSKLEAMLHRSSNSATNWAMAQVGGPIAVQRLLEQHYGHLLQETCIVETIPTNGRTYRNMSSARDYVRFSRALWRNELPGSREIRRIMSLPGSDRLATGASDIPSDTQVINKTGTTSHLCGDFGILVTRAGTDELPYVIVGIIEKRNRARGFSSWISSRSRVIRGVSNLTYNALKSHYG
ncbi:MAG: serine hydrolase [Myxococcales bacterium]|nr:serine hydrolase [Myxococcales bacterium]